MKIVLQRVLHAKVDVNKATVGQINRGYLALVGFAATDTQDTVCEMLSTIKKLRLFADENGKTNLSITDIGGELLIVSQFTLYANCSKGTRPSFTDAAPPALALQLYDHFVEEAAQHFTHVASGNFGASMQVSLTNDGPFTVVLDL